MAFWASNLGAELGLENFDMVIEEYFSKEPIINDHSSAMTKKQRKIFSKGAEELQENDEVVKQCLQDKQYTATGEMFFHRKL